MYNEIVRHVSRTAFIDVTDGGNKVSIPVSDLLVSYNIVEGGGGGGGSFTWGTGIGTLSSQLDLQAALDLKANTTALDLKSNIASPIFTGVLTTPLIKITGGVPGVGKVLTSDADGDATWETPSAGGTIDAVPTNGSTNAVQSDGVFDALALKANLASPTFTGTPTLPTGTIAVTQSAGNSTTAIATTAFATTALNLKANLASPTFTGTPAAPTAAAATSTTQIATTAFVTTANNLKANAASPTITGTANIANIQIPTSGLFWQGASAQTSAKELFNITRVETNTTAATRPVLALLEYALNPSAPAGGQTDYHGLDVTTYGSNNFNSSTGLYAIEGRMALSGNSTLGKGVGVYGLATNTSASGTASELDGMQAMVQNTSTGTVTAANGILIRTPVNTSGTITTNIGLNIANQNVGTNQWAIKTGLGKVEFGDVIKITGGSPGVGKVLTSDADGDATWEAPTGGISASSTDTLTNKTMSGDDNTFSNIPASAILVGDTEEFDPTDYALLASPTFTGTVTIPTVKITGGSPGAGKILTSDADGDATWETAGPTGGTSLADRRTSKFEFFTDFINAPQSSGSFGTSNDFLQIPGGTGALVSYFSTNSEGNRPGVVALSTGTDSTGYVAMYAGGGMKVGAGAWIVEADVRVPVLSTSGQRFVVKVGLFNEITDEPELDAVSFIYDEGGVSTGAAASANWQLCTSNSSTRTFTTTSTAVVAATWYTLRIEANAGGTSVTFYINGASAGTHTTNIPTGARNVTMAAGIYKSVGTTARVFDMDYYSAELTFTTPR